MISSYGVIRGVGKYGFSFSLLQPSILMNCVGMNGILSEICE